MAEYIYRGDEMRSLCLVACALLLNPCGYSDSNHPTKRISRSFLEDFCTWFAEASDKEGGPRDELIEFDIPERTDLRVSDFDACGLATLGQPDFDPTKVDCVQLAKSVNQGLVDIPIERPPEKGRCRWVHGAMLKIQMTPPFRDPFTGETKLLLLISHRDQRPNLWCQVRTVEDSDGNIMAREFKEFYDQF